MGNLITVEWTEIPDPPVGTRMFRVGHAGQWSPWMGDDIGTDEAQFASVTGWADGTLTLEPIEAPETERELLHESGHTGSAE